MNTLEPGRSHGMLMLQARVRNSHLACESPAGHVTVLSADTFKMEKTMTCPAGTTVQQHPTHDAAMALPVHAHTKAEALY